MIEITIDTKGKADMVDITSKVQKEITDKIEHGNVVIYTPHTTAGITINEGADPDVQRDILQFLNKTIPWDESYFKHTEGNSAAHIKAVLMGNSVQVIVEDGEIKLGMWEKIFFCEFDGPRNRKIWISF